MENVEDLYSNPFSYYVECLFTRKKVREVILDEVYNITVGNKLDSFERLMGHIPTHIAKTVSISSVVTEEELKRAFLLAQAAVREEETKQKNELTPSERKLYARLYEKCGGKDPKCL